MYTETVTKLFYNIYPYRITYPRLGNLPKFYYRTEKPSEHSWMIRQQCHQYLKKEFKGRIKFNNGYHTHAYFLKKEDYLKAKEEFKELHVKYTEPLFPDLKDILDKFDSNVDLRKSRSSKGCTRGLVSVSNTFRILVPPAVLASGQLLPPYRYLTSKKVSNLIPYFHCYNPCALA